MSIVFAQNCGENAWLVLNRYLLDSFDKKKIFSIARYRLFITVYYFYFFSFMLYTACSWVRVLRHSAPYFPPNAGGIASRLAELNAALCLDTSTKKWLSSITYFYFINRLGRFPGGAGSSPATFKFLYIF